MRRSVVTGALLLAAMNAHARTDTRLYGPDAFRPAQAVDGDTLRGEWFVAPLSMRLEDVRPRGVDTPERHHICADPAEQAALRAQARRAQEFLQAVIDAYPGQDWTITQVSANVYSGRMDAVVLTPDGENLGDILLNSGLARRSVDKRASWCSR